MKFISVGSIAKNQASSKGRSAFKNSTITFTQSKRTNKDKENLIFTIRITDDLIEKARFKRGDRIDIKFSEDGKSWVLKTADENCNKSYKLSMSNEKSKTGVISYTWYEGMPILDNNKDVKLAQAKISFENEMDVNKVEIGKILFTLPNQSNFSITKFEAT